MGRVRSWIPWALVVVLMATAAAGAVLGATSGPNAPTHREFREPLFSPRNAPSPWRTSHRLVTAGSRISALLVLCRDTFSTMGPRRSWAQACLRWPPRDCLRALRCTSIGRMTPSAATSSPRFRPTPRGRRFHPRCTWVDSPRCEASRWCSRAQQFRPQSSGALHPAEGSRAARIAARATRAPTPAPPVGHRSDVRRPR